MRRRCLRQPERADAVDPNCGFYLRQEHQLIRRHEESLTLNADNTVLWKLRIDFELPSADEAGYQPKDAKERLFLFPLVYLKKQDGRIGISAHDERDGTVSLPIRTECDEISAIAVKQAIDKLISKLPRHQRALDEKEVGELLQALTATKPYLASMALGDLERKLGLAPSGEPPRSRFPEVAEKVSESTLPESLTMLVEHSLVWVTFRGYPGERRSVVLSQEVALDRRSVVRWSFGDLDVHRQRRAQRRAEIRRSLRLEKPWLRLRRSLLTNFARRHGPHRPPPPVLTIGRRRYGRRDRRFSFSALGERIGQPLAWMPFEFRLPTIYTKRCRSYHFEVRVPPGRTPRDIRMSYGPHLAEPPDSEAPSELTNRDVRKTATARAVRVDLPRKFLGDIITFRVTVGVGDGAFPILWFLAAAITAAMLWIFAASDPPLSHERGQIGAGILLTVPALIAALALSSNEVPVSQLVGGARILLLVTGLSAVLAAAALAGAKPFQMGPRWTFTAAAMAATAAAVPLGTSWLLSRPTIWRLMMALDSQSRQEGVLMAGVVAALVLSASCTYLDKGLVARASLAVLLLALTILMSTVANDRAALPMNRSRHYISLCFLLAGVACLALACIELSAVAGHEATRLQEWAERGAWGLLLLASVSGDILSWITSFASPRPDEVHVSPKVGRALLAQESVARLPILFERERQAGTRPEPQKQQKTTNG